MLILTDEPSNKNTLGDFNNSAIFLSRVKNLLDYATENQNQHIALQIAIQLYHSRSKKGREELCGSL